METKENRSIFENFQTNKQCSVKFENYEHPRKCSGRAHEGRARGRAQVRHRSSTRELNVSTSFARRHNARATEDFPLKSCARPVHDLEIARETPRDLIFASAVSPIETRRHTDKPSHHVNLPGQC